MFFKKLKQEWNYYLADPFGYVDDLKLEWRNWDFNIIKESASIRRIVFVMALVFALVWLIMGFDSGVGQINFPLVYVFGQVVKFQPIDWSEAIRLYHWAYGKYMHWSVFTIYGLAFWFLSRYYEKMGIKGSQNFAYSFSTVLFSIGIFEWFWMISYYVFQGQPWILKFEWPQSRLLFQNLALTFIGLLSFFQIYAETKFKPRLDGLTTWLIMLALASCFLWIYYPFTVTPLSVKTTTGTWVNSNLFPQTVYTIDTDPLDLVNAGEQFFLEDNMIHLVNTIAKVFVTMAIVCLGLIVPKTYKEHELIRNEL